MRRWLGRDLEFRPVTLSVENEVFAALGESLGDDLCVEGMRESCFIGHRLDLESTSAWLPKSPQSSRSILSCT